MINNERRILRHHWISNQITALKDLRTSLKKIKISELIEMKDIWKVIPQDEQE